MGFNISVYSENEAANAGCYQFVDRALYNFINTGEQYGDRSILLQSGQYYGLDVSPLLKLVYTNDEVPEEYVKANLQNTNMLLSLVISFRDRIKADPSVCDKVDHVRYEQILNMSQNELDGLRRELGDEMIKTFMEMIEQQQKGREQNPSPWKLYFEGGQIISDLDDFIKAIQCYEGKGVKEIYLTAG